MFTASRLLSEQGVSCCYRNGAIKIAVRFQAHLQRREVLVLIYGFGFRDWVFSGLGFWVQEGTRHALRSEAPKHPLAFPGSSFFSPGLAIDWMSYSAGAAPEVLVLLYGFGIWCFGV